MNGKILSLDDPRATKYSSRDVLTIALSLCVEHPENDGVNDFIMQIFDTMRARGYTGSFEEDLYIMRNEAGDLNLWISIVWNRFIFDDDIARLAGKKEK